MIQIAMVAAAWYAVPKGIEYLTSRPHHLESRVDCIRERLFTYKSACQGLANANRLTRFIWKATYIPYSHMWLAALIAPGLIKLLRLAISLHKPTYVLLCYSLFYGKEISESKLIAFINSSQMLRFVTTQSGYRLVSSDLGLYIINRYTEYSPENRELLDILQQRLDYATAHRLLTTELEHSSSILDKAWISRRAREMVAEPIHYETSLPCLPNYPEDIHDTDPILSKIRCPILGRPPRSIITDPTNPKIMYDQQSFETYLESSNISPITRKNIPKKYSSMFAGGSKYDSIIRYRKACLGLRSLEDPEGFITGISEYFFSARRENSKVFISKMLVFNLRACLELKNVADPKAFISKVKSIRPPRGNLGPFILKIFIANLEAAYERIKESLDPKSFVARVFMPNLEKAYLQLESQDLTGFMFEKIIPNLERVCLQLESQQSKCMVKKLIPHIKGYVESAEECVTSEDLETEKRLINALEKACLQLEEVQEVREMIIHEVIPDLQLYAKLRELHSLRGFIDEELSSTLGTYLRLRQLQEPEKFIAHLKQIFLEIAELEKVHQVKNASEGVRDFFQEGFFAAYDVSELVEDQQGHNFFTPSEEQLIGKVHIAASEYESYKMDHNSNQYASNIRPITSYGDKKFIGVSINDFERYPFIMEELKLEIQKIKEERQELIQEFV